MKVCIDSSLLKCYEEFNGIIIADRLADSIFYYWFFCYYYYWSYIL